mgnify:CR=1 FL=1
MKKLIVSGCSWGDKNFYSQFHPEMDCDWPKWPQLLAEKLNMECINLCKSGAGQEYIYSSLSDEILNHNREDIGFVMAAWSTAPRRCYKIKNRWTIVSKNHYDLTAVADNELCVEYENT